MRKPLTLQLKSCDDPSLVGGKAAGLGRLHRSGFRVPPGLCLTTDVYRDALRAAGVDASEQWAKLRRASDAAREPILEECRRRVEALSLSQAVLDALEGELNKLESTAGLRTGTLWAVRSSASNEDGTEATSAGVYRTLLGVSRGSIAAAITQCWASLWTSAATSYHARTGAGDGPPAMAVIVQPLLMPWSAGVAYSRHPVTGHTGQVVINATFGLAEPLVAGRVTPDQYVVEVVSDPPSRKLLDRILAEKTSIRVATPTGIRDQSVPEEVRLKPVLGDEEAMALAGLVKDVERAFQSPVDVEWAIENGATWLLQARAIPKTGSQDDLTEQTCTWSRANFKETLPELPSPLGLWFVHEFMETNILRQYRELGCTIPSRLSAVLVIQGRPFINVSLFQSFTVQLGGNPALVTEQMGGEAQPLPSGPPRLPWWKLIRAAVLMEWKIRGSARHAPGWFAEMKRMYETPSQDSVRTTTPAELLARLDALGQRLQEGDLTLPIVAGVAQALQALEFLLKRWVGAGWRAWLNASLEGLGTVISAQQIFQLRDLAELARSEPVVMAYFRSEPFEPRAFRLKLAGTRFLQQFNVYLGEFGHRALGESDVMSPRFSEDPEYLLGIIRSHLLAPPAKVAGDQLHEQRIARNAALDEIHRRLRRRWPLWAIFRWWYRRLCRYLALREANRHHLMYFSAATRMLTLLLGEHICARGTLPSKDDIFFLTPDEFRACASGEVKDWKGLVAARRSERARHAEQTVPDVVAPGGVPGFMTGGSHEDSGTLSGIPISAGYAEGPVRLVLTPEQARRVERGDILVLPVIDPGMAPLFGLAGGLIVEMGGTLSHGAIIAREYGIPAVANVRSVTRLLKNGERVTVDATRGEIRRRDPA